MRSAKCDTASWAQKASAINSFIMAVHSSAVNVSGATGGSPDVGGVQVL